MSAYTALLNAFFVSITALIPHTNIGYPAVVLGLIGLVNTLSLGRHVWDERRQGQEPLWSLRRPSVLLVGSLAIYGLQLWYAVPLLRTPRATDNVYGLSYLMLGTYTVGLTRAWELLGTTREGLTTLLSSRREGSTATTERATAQRTHSTRPDERAVSLTSDERAAPPHER